MYSVCSVVVWWWHILVIMTSQFPDTVHQCLSWPTLEYAGEVKQRWTLTREFPQLGQEIELKEKTHAWICRLYEWEWMGELRDRGVTWPFPNLSIHAFWEHSSLPCIQHYLCIRVILCSMIICGKVFKGSSQIDFPSDIRLCVSQQLSLRFLSLLCTRVD